MSLPDSTGSLGELEGVLHLGRYSKTLARYGFSMEGEEKNTQSISLVPSPLSASTRAPHSLPCPQMPSSLLVSPKVTSIDLSENLTGEGVGQEKN